MLEPYPNRQEGADRINMMNWIKEMEAEKKPDPN
jgi:hypothetical protein